jgi:hypothetical protein
MRPLALATTLTTLIVSNMSAQQGHQCPDRFARRGDLGIERLRCIGPSAACSINLLGDDGTPTHRFTVEPEVVRVSPGSDVRQGDVVVAVDSTLITTIAGGRRLANLTPGVMVRLLVRRGGRLLELTLTAGQGCGVTSLNVTRGTEA